MSIDNFLDGGELPHIPEPEPVAPKSKGLFVPAVKRGVGSVLAETGQLTGSEGLKKTGEQLEQENPQQVALGDLPSRPGGYVSETLGEQLPRLGVSFGAAAGG